MTAMIACVGTVSEERIVSSPLRVWGLIQFERVCERSHSGLVVFEYGVPHEPVLRQCTEGLRGG